VHGTGEEQGIRVERDEVRRKKGGLSRRKTDGSLTVSGWVIRHRAGENNDIDPVERGSYKVGRVGKGSAGCVS